MTIGMMKSEATALRDARQILQEVERELRNGRGRNQAQRYELAGKINRALVDMTTADIQAGRKGVGAALTLPPGSAR